MCASLRPSASTIGETFGMIACYINNVLTPADCLRVRDMNFGQAVALRQPLVYRLLLAYPLLTEVMAPYYSDFAVDDLQYGTPHEHPTTLALRALQWPPLPTLAAHYPALFVAFLRDHASYDMLTKVFSTPATVRYCLNTVDAVVAQDHQLLVTGACYPVNS